MDKAKMKALIGEMSGMKPPPGVIQNLEHPPTMQNWNLLCQVICLSLSTICVLIRMYTKIFITKSHGWEDCMLRGASFDHLMLELTGNQILALSHG